MMKYAGNLRTILAFIVLVTILLTNTMVPIQQVQAQVDSYQIYLPAILKGNQTSAGCVFTRGFTMALSAEPIPYSRRS